MKYPYLPLDKITALHADELLDATQRVVRSGRYLMGAELERFEQRFASYIGTRHCIGCGNGLDALSLILRAYKALGVLENGDEVLVSAHTFVATFLAITENGLTPVPVEARLDTMQLDPTHLADHVTPRTRALVLVHLYGNCAYTDEVAAFCRRHNLRLIEDNAQAHGLTLPDGRRTGALGDAAGHSFYPGKNLGAMGDGGAVTTNDDDLARMVRTLGNYGSAQKYVHEYEGRNSRLDELQAAVLNVKLTYLDEENARRRAIAHRYIAALSSSHRGTIVPTLEAGWQNAVFHIFPLRVADELSVGEEGRQRGDDVRLDNHSARQFAENAHRTAIQQQLAARGVQTLIHYPTPPHLQPCYPHLHGLSLPLTERLCHEELSLPCHPAMTDAEVEGIIDVLTEVC